MGHAKLSPSASSRWLNCPASVIMLEDLGNPNKSSTFANEGSVAHLLAETCLRDDLDPEDFLSLSFNEYPDIEVDHEMVRGVEYYIACIKELNRDTDQFSEVEKRCPLFYSLGEYGSSDFVNITKGGTLHVWDLKYGANVQVSAKKNTQGIIYGISTYDELCDIFDITKVVIHIIQPRMNWVESETLTLEEVEEWREVIQAGADATEDPLAPCIPGEKQCQWCNAKGSCEALADFNLELLASDFDEIDGDDKPKSKTGILSDRQIQTALQNQSLITSWLKAVHGVVHDAIERGDGDRFPEFKLVSGRSSRKFGDEKAAEKYLKGNFKLDECMPRKMLTAPQAEKLAKNAKKSTRFFKKFNALVTKPAGNPTLAPIGDKREALVFNEFEEIEEDIDLDDLLGE